MLAGLIVASASAEGEPLLRAELPIAGQTLIEHQVRLLSAAGASHLVILVERMPAPLLAAIDRLKRDGIAIDIARDVADAADRIHPDERLIVMADGVVIDRAPIDLLLAEPGNAILTVPDTPDHAMWERIDATARWAGLMVLDGALLRQTAAMLGDWDLQSTLLRRAVQSGALFVDAPAAVLAILDRRSAAPPLDVALARRADGEPKGITDRFLFAPLARTLAPPAMTAMLQPEWFRWAARGLVGVAAALFVAGWTSLGLAAMLASGPVAAIGRRIAMLGWRRPASAEAVDWRQVIAALALIALAWRRAVDGDGWGMIAVTLTIIAFFVAIADHCRFIGAPPKRPIWLAGLDDAIWLMLPFALFGIWSVGMGAIALQAFASLLMLQRLTARKGR